MQTSVFDVLLILFFALFDNRINDAHDFADGRVKMIFQPVVINALFKLFGKPGPSMAVLLAGTDQGYIIFNLPATSLLRRGG